MAHNKVVVDEVNQQTLDQPVTVRQFVELDECSIATMFDDGKCRAQSDYVPTGRTGKAPHAAERSSAFTQ